MDLNSVAIIVSAILGLLGASWGGYALAKKRVRKKLAQAGDLIKTFQAASEDGKFTKEEVEQIFEKFKALVTFEKEPTDA